MLKPKATKPKKCRVCTSTFTPSRMGQKVCGAICALTFARSVRAKDEKREAVKERRETKAKLEKFKKIPELTAAAQKEFNLFVRTRDAKEPCISCGKPPGDMSGLHAGRDAGHYRSIGCASHLRFNEDNCHAQCVHCNQWKAGNAIGYRLGLIARIGAQRVDALETNQEVRKWTREELIAIKATYTAKAKELKARQS